MNRKQFGILFVVLVLLGASAWYVLKQRTAAANTVEVGAGKKLLGESFPLNDVAQISFKQGTNSLDLVKKDDLWRVAERNNYPANFSSITDFLIKLQDLKIVQVEHVTDTQAARLQLMADASTNSGVALDLKTKEGKSLQSLVFGKKHVRKPAGRQPSPFGGDDGFPDGRYLLLGGDKHTALLVGEPLNNAEAKPEAWLNKDFFRIERPKSVAVTYPEATNSWKLDRDTESGEWKLADAKPDEKLDPAKAASVSNPFSAPSFEDVSTVSKPEELGLDKPTVIKVETFDDLTYTVTVGKKMGENYPLTLAVAANFPKDRVPAKDEKPEEKDKADKAWKERQKQLEEKFKQAKGFENWTYLLPSWNVDAILKPRKDLLAEKKEEPKPAENPAPVVPPATDKK